MLRTPGIGNMGRLFSFSLFALLLSSGTASNIARAQAPISAPTPPRDAVIVSEGPVIGGPEPLAAFGWSAGQVLPENTGHRKHRLGAWLRDHPWYCWASINSVGCGSLKSECDFVFGSCRRFFGEPCLKGPPPPVPPWYGVDGRCGCR